MNFTTRSSSPNIFDLTCDGSGTGGQGWYDIAIAVDPANAEVVYAGGVDVLRSTDGGTSWLINSQWWGGCSVPAVHADCHYLAFSPLSGTLYACNDGGLFGSQDEGLSWLYYSETMTIGQIYKISLARTDKEKIICGFQDNGTYTRLANGWIQTGGGDGMECAIDPADESNTFHTTYGGDIYRRINNTGQTHIAGIGVNGINEYGGWITPFILSKSNHNRMFVGFRNIWKTEDVFNTNSVIFSKLSDTLAGSNGIAMTAIEQSEADSNLFYAMRSDRKLFRSDNCLDASPVWINLSSSWPSVLWGTSLAAHPTNPNIIYLTAGKQVFKSTDKGNSWTEITGNLPSVHVNTIVYYKNSDEGLYVGTDAGVYYSDANTVNWISFNQGLPLSAQITELEIYYDNDSVSQDVIRAGSYGRGLWSSTMYNSVVSGISETRKESFTLYPNPSNGLFILETKSSPETRILSVLTVEGLEIYSRELPPGNIPLKENLDLRQLAKGIYFIRISGDSGAQTNKLILY